MDYYIKEFEELKKDFEEYLKKYPLFSEMINDIFDKDIKEINELLEKNDLFYLKKAISKMKDLNKFIKDTSLDIDKQYEIFNDLCTKLDKINIKNQDIDKVNQMINKANTLIKSHDIKNLHEANKILEKIIKEERL